MSNTTPSGWYPDPESVGSQRYWDGQTWTEHRAPGAMPISAVGVVDPAPSGSPRGSEHTSTAGLPAPKDPWFKKRWVLVIAAAAVGLAVGASTSGSTDPTSTGAYKRLSSRLDTAKADLTDAQAATADAKAALGDLPSRQADLAAGQQKLKSDQDALASRESDVTASEKAVAKREKVVGKTEDLIAANTLSGEGVYEVGTDIKAGTYKTKGGSDCYYAILNSSDTFDIASNNNTSGPASVTVRNGQYLELSGCDDFVLQP
ncbi:MAG: putative rane-bound protein [Nocardioidaceae bacterium]|nr:putative rane-bound protein [Nocardioidaceae bacterium]